MAVKTARKGNYICPLYP